MSAPYIFNDHRLAKTRSTARRLGELVTDGQLTEEDAQLTLGLVIEEGVKALPGVDRRGLQTRLVWDMREHAQGILLTRRRHERAQEKSLTDLAESGHPAKAPLSEIKRRMVALAKTMNPQPSIEMCESALRLGAWRAKWGGK